MMMIAAGCDLNPLSHKLDAGRDTLAADGPPADTRAADVMPPLDRARADSQGLPACPAPPKSVKVDPALLAGAYADIAVDPVTGDLHISHQNGSDDAVYSGRLGGVWRNELILAKGRVGWHTAIALAPSGDVHVVFGDVDGQLMHAVRNSTGWSVPKTISGTASGGLDLAIDSAGNLLLVCFTTAQELHLLRRTGSTWVDGGLLDSSCNQWSGPSIALDKSGQPHISLCTTSGQLKVIDGTQPARVWDAQLGQFCRTGIGVDPSSGNVHVVYGSPFTKTVWYVGQGNGTYGQPIQLDTTGDTGVAGGVSLAVAEKGDLWVVYTKVLAGLGVVRRKSGVWGPPQYVDGMWGAYPTAALGPGGLLHAAHTTVWFILDTGLRYTRFCP